MQISRLASVSRITAAVASLIHVAVLAVEKPSDGGKNLNQLLLATWEVGLDTKGSMSVDMTLPLRVSTYSQPAFIHRAQLEHLQRPFKDLSGICLKLGGQWIPVDTTSAPGKALVPSPSNSPEVAEAIQTRKPMTETAKKIVEIGNQSTAREAYKATLSALERKPDRLVTDALEYAESQKWLGNFKCIGSASNWTAAILYRDSTNRGSGPAIYKDVIFRVNLQESR